MSLATALDGQGHLLALLDARIDPDYDESECREDQPACRAIGPQGDECHRAAGHYDTDVFGNEGVGKHVGYSTDHYQAWPVGWRHLSERIATVIDPHFAEKITADRPGDEQYRLGVADALAQVRRVLGDPRNG